MTAILNTIYIEESLRTHPRVMRILQRYPDANIIYCQYYGEVFNPKSQNFRIQKQNPALILAKKTGRKVLTTPEGFGVGGHHNYYFSHMLNCIYDCRYCFLQGMYQSAHYVVFVNYEDFMDEIKTVASSLQSPAYFFSGYDCDSLAFEPVTHFLSEFLPFFERIPNAILELRTKSANVNPLLKHRAFDQCVVAFSFTPQEISQRVEHKVPAVEKRIAAIKKLVEAGWKIGLRFDPLIYASDFEEMYENLIDEIFAQIKSEAIHSVSVGPMRFPDRMYQKLVKLYPSDKLLAHPLYKRGRNFSYTEDLENKMQQFIKNRLKQYLDQSLIFQCHAL